MRRLAATLLVLSAAATAAAPAAAYDATALKATIAREMALASPSSSAYVQDLDSGQELFSLRAGTPRVPASVEKLYTTSTTLLRFGPLATLATSAVSAGEVDDAGVLHGDLVLVGGGDPFFGAQSAAKLARAVRATGIERIDGAVVGDESEFDRLRSGCCESYDSDLGGVLSSLAFDRGIAGGRAQLGAARFAATRFAELLRVAGVPSSAKAHAGSAPSGAATLAAVDSMDVRTLIRFVNVPSNNFAAEMLLKGLGARYGARGSTRAGAAVVRTTLDDIGVRPHVSDGSGLSRKDRTTPRDVVRLLARMDKPDVAGVFRASLAIAGRTGTVKARMRGTAAEQRCRVKTGTLRAVSALAGYCRTVSGRNIAFALLMNRVFSYVGAHAIQDKIAASIASLDGAPAATTPPATTIPTTPAAPTTTTGGGATPR
jgi:D-alanyl-D-alanine carboxypeptidase/D-alanyl-D-alanine-endopeptidase (penicillin-binding protein 4)